MTNKRPKLPSPLQLFQRTRNIILTKPIVIRVSFRPYIFKMLSPLLGIHPQIADELLFRCLPIIQENELTAVFV